MFTTVGFSFLVGFCCLFLVGWLLGLFVCLFVFTVWQGNSVEVFKFVPVGEDVGDGGWLSPLCSSTCFNSV